MNVTTKFTKKTKTIVYFFVSFVPTVIVSCVSWYTGL
jgi:hypothetical protein